MTREKQRLTEYREGTAEWHKWGPYLSERSWGTVREDYSPNGGALKEYYFYVDSTPTHSYMKYVYKYPQGEYPYRWLVEENGRRGGTGPEFELLDTGLFDENRYFDVFV